MDRGAWQAESDLTERLSTAQHKLYKVIIKKLVLLGHLSCANPVTHVNVISSFDPNAWHIVGAEQFSGEIFRPVLCCWESHVLNFSTGTCVLTHTVYEENFVFQ